MSVRRNDRHDIHFRVGRRARSFNGAPLLDEMELSSTGLHLSWTGHGSPKK